MLATASTCAGRPDSASCRNARLTTSSSINNRCGPIVLIVSGFAHRSGQTDYSCSMRITHAVIKLLLFAAACVAGGAQAKQLELRVAHLSTGAGSLQGVTILLDWPDGA